MNKLLLRNTMMSLFLLTILASAGWSDSPALNELSTIAGPAALSAAPTSVTPKVCSSGQTAGPSTGLWHRMSTKGSVNIDTGMACDGNTLHPTAVEVTHSWYRIGAPSELIALGACTQMIFFDPSFTVPPAYDPIDCPRCPNGSLGCHAAARLDLDAITLEKEDPNCQHTPQHPSCWYKCSSNIKISSSVGTQPRGLWRVKFMCTPCP